MHIVLKQRKEKKNRKFYVNNSNNNNNDNNGDNNNNNNAQQQQQQQLLLLQLLPLLLLPLLMLIIVQIRLNNFLVAFLLSSSLLILCSRSIQSAEYCEQMQLAGNALIQLAINYLQSTAEGRMEETLAQSKKIVLECFPEDNDIRHIRTKRGLKVRAVTFEELCEQTIDNLRQHVSSVHENPGQSHGGRSRFKLLSLENISSHHLVKLFVQKAVQLEEEYARADDREKAQYMMPLITFHGTSDRKNVESIKQSGILSAGDHSREGLPIYMAHGNTYGAGTYVSPSLEKADVYAFRDKYNQRQVFVSLALPGHTNMLRLQNNKKNKSWMRTDAITHHSRLTEDQQELILFDSAQCLPLFLMTYNEDGACAMASIAYVDLSVAALTRLAINESRKYDEKAGNKKSCDYKKGDPESAASSKAVSSTSWRDLQIAEERAKRLEYDPVLHFFPVPGTGGAWHTCALSTADLELRFPTLETTVPSVNKVLIFILDRSASLGSHFRRIVLPACAQLYTALQPTQAQAVFFGSSVSTTLIESASAFERNELTHMSLEDATNIAGGLDAAADLALKIQVETGNKELGRTSDGG